MGLAQPRQRLGQDNPIRIQDPGCESGLGTRGLRSSGKAGGSEQPKRCHYPGALVVEPTLGFTWTPSAVGIGNPTLAAPTRACGQINLSVQVDHKRWWVSATQPLPAPRERPG